MHLRYIMFFALILGIGLAQHAQAQPAPNQTGGPEFSSPQAKEFMTSVTYGVLAGTLVGAATLAFEDRPGDNLQRVARGASIGLYLGIALGLYVMYGVPGGDEEGLEGQLPPSGKLMIPLPTLDTKGRMFLVSQWSF